MRELLAAGAVVVPFVLGVTAAPGNDGETVFTFQDPAIVESSGLVALDGLFVTTNDSGDEGRVFVVDPGSGRTVGVTSWSEEPEDVEALAPAGAGSVWVADIGDNLESRDTVEVSEVPVGTGERTADEVAYELLYPRGPGDAETLLAHPRTGRLYVVSKHPIGGTMYATPARLAAERPNRLREVGQVLGFATDGAFFPSGRHLILRDYGRAVVYTFPALEPVGTVPLPDQEQGEGIAVAADGAVYVSSEGRNSAVLQVPLPPQLRSLTRPQLVVEERAKRAARNPGSSATPQSPAPESPDPSTRSREGVELPEQDPGRREPWQWGMGGLLFVGACLLLLLAVRPR